MRPLAAVLVLGACSTTSTDALPTFPVMDSSGSGLTVLASAEGHAQLPLLTTPFGTNGRFCETCHSVLNAWTLTPSDDLSRFMMGRKSPTVTDGGAPISFADNATATTNDDLDPLFRVVDGATSPNADASTASARQAAYALLFSKALIRIGLPMPANADFTLATVDDPYAYATASELSLYRRTLPMTNLVFEQTIMWDGRETALAQQAADATIGHAQAAAAPPADVLSDMVVGETSTYFAQQSDSGAGDLGSDGALGGPTHLQTQPFYAGINSFPGPDPRGAAFSPVVFTLYAAWAGSTNASRAAIARGEDLFNTRTFAVPGLGARATCSTCHNTPNVGTSSTGLLFDVGVADASRRTSDVPLYTFMRTATAEQRQTSDPGQALVTGRWDDIGKFKTPGLRGLAARAPYFHDGSAASIADVVDYFDTRFGIGLSALDKTDLEAFLLAL